MELAILCYAGAAGVLMIGGGVLWVAAQVAGLLKDVRATTLPQLDKTLIDLQANLNRIDTLTQDVDTTVGEANQLVASANRTVKTVEDGLTTFRNKVAIPSLIAALSIKEGFKAGARALAARRQARRANDSGPVEAKARALEVQATEVSDGRFGAAEASSANR